MLEGGRKYTQIGLVIGIKVGGDAAKIRNNNHLLVIIHVALSQKIGLCNLIDWTQFKK